MGIRPLLKQLRQQFGGDAFRLEARKFDTARRAVDGITLGLTPDLINHMLHGPERPVCHIDMEKPRLFAALVEWICELDSLNPDDLNAGNFGTSFPQMAALGLRDALVVPILFTHPYLLRVKGREHPFPLCSGPAILAEAKSAAEILRLEKTFAKPRLPSFMRANRRMVTEMEHEHELDEKFWVQFGLIALLTLIEHSQSSLLPVIISDHDMPAYE